jgi:hypothetical protein
MATRKTSARPTPKLAPAASVKKKATAKSGGAEGLLRAGLKALGNVRNDVVKRQTNVIEGLLGIHKGDASANGPAVPRGFAGLDAFGIRKFEDVFDQRVATALQRLGMPAAQELQALRDEVQQLRDEVQQLREQLALPKPAARRKR